MKRAALWFRFYDRAGEQWSVYLAHPAHCPQLRKDKNSNGKPYLGRCVPAQCAIYVDATQTEDALFDTTLHEMIHATFADKNLPDQLEESIADAVATALWPMLKSAPTQWPPLPARARAAMKEG